MEIGFLKSPLERIRIISKKSFEMKKLLSVVFSLFMVAACYGQYDIHYSLYMFNKLAINPAYAGSKEAMTLSGHYRNQWEGISGAPETFTVSAHTPFFKKRSGLGLNILADKIGIVQSYNIGLSYAYRIPIKKGTTLSIGLDGQFEYARLDWNEVDPLDSQDDFIPAAQTNKFNPNFGMGLYYNAPKFFVGFSMPRILKTTIFDDNPIQEAGINNLRSYYLMSGFIFKVAKNVNFQPGFLMTYNRRTPFELDLNASFVFMDRLWLGASYRLEDSFDLLAQFQLTDQLKAALAVDFTLSELNNYSPGSFELMLEYIFIRTGERLNNIRYF